MSSNKKGILGTKKAKEFFKENGWTMFKVEPESRTIGRARHGFIISYVDNIGIPDFLGTDSEGSFCGVEVKAAPNDWKRFPCSYVSKSQREFMNKAPMPCFVGIFWSDQSFEIFDFKAKGSYRKGSGLAI